MYQSNDINLQDFMTTNGNIESSALIISEINMNNAININKIGNYRYRPAEDSSQYYEIADIYDSDDVDINYTNATDSAVAELSEDGNSIISFNSIAENKKLYFSLQDCFGRFRPRSGINKGMFWGSGINERYLGYDNPEMMKRPRYYVASKDDKFKYWTSIRSEDEKLQGISDNDGFISDTAPFVIYNEQIPVNRVILKIQTHSGLVNLGPFRDSSGNVFNDPFYDNAVYPTHWKMQYLDADNNWTDMFDSGGTLEINTDGYVELQYRVVNGVADWVVGDGSINDSMSFVKDFISPTALNDGIEYEEFQYIGGLRLVVSKMNKPNVSFDLIEMSPRLAIDLTDVTKEFKIDKVASDLGVSGMPVGQLLASNGSIIIADYDDAFNTLNTNSVIAKHIGRNLQIKFFEGIKVSDSTYEYIPLKVLYAESFPEFNMDSKEATIKLRDMYFYLEALTAPQILLTNVSMSYAIAMLLDSIGFTNYVYKKLNSDQYPEPIIPFFFIPPDTTVAEILKRLATSTQTAMFFDEENNFILMSREYLMPNNELERQTDLTLTGGKDADKINEINAYRNSSDKMSDIIEIASKENNIFNSGVIRYTSRYIQKSLASIKQASQLERDRTWIYKPTLLWEVSGEDTIKAVNDETKKQSTYTLSAIPLASTLSADDPYVDANGVVQNNIMDFGDGISYLDRYNGYMHSGSEIIRFDAVEFNFGKEVEIAKGLIGMVSEGSNTVTLINGCTTANLAVGQIVDQVGTYTEDRSTKYSAELVGNNSVNILSGGTTKEMYVGQELTKISVGSNLFTNVTLLQPDIVMLNPKDDTSTVDSLYIGEKVSMNSSIAPNLKFKFDIERGNERPKKILSNISCVTPGYESITDKKEIYDLIINQISDLNLTEEMRKIYVDEDDRATLRALPKDAKIASVDYDAKEDTLTITLNKRPRKAMTGAQAYFTTYYGELSQNTDNYITGFLTKEENPQYWNRMFRVSQQHKIYGLLNGALKIGASDGTFGVDEDNKTIVESIVNTTSFTTTVNHDKLGPLTFMGADTLEGTLDETDPTSTNPLRITSIDQSSNNIFTVSKPAIASGGILIDIVNKDGNVWISDVDEYKNYFSKIPFNGKLYPTGRVRIYSKPFFDENGNRKPGAVEKSGRGQFYTNKQEHFAGISDYWTDQNNITGSLLNFTQVFKTVTESSIVVETRNNSSGISGKAGTVRIYVYSSENLAIGQTIEEVSIDEEVGRKIAAGTQIVSVGSKRTRKSTKAFIEINKPLLKDLTGDSITVKDAKIIKEEVETIGGDSLSLKLLDGVYTTAKNYAKETRVNSIIRNFLSNSYYSDDAAKKLTTADIGTLQASAMVMNGRTFQDPTVIKPTEFLSIIKKDISAEVDNPKHFGTRLRIVGKINNDNNLQTPSGATSYFAAQPIGSDTVVNLQGGSAGLCFMVKDGDNDVVGIRGGYFFEIAALSDPFPSATKYANIEQLDNIIFHKVSTNVGAGNIKQVSVQKKKASEYSAIYRLTPNDSFKKIRKNDEVFIFDGDGSTVPSIFKSQLVSGEYTSFKVKSVSSIKETDTDNVEYYEFTVDFNPASTTIEDYNGDTYYFNNGEVRTDIQKTRKAVSQKLWSGLAQILVDDGLFTGQYRITGDQNPTVYDLAVEYIYIDNEETGGKSLKFMLYLNNKLVGTVIDTEPLYSDMSAAPKNVGTFVRGSATAMFEKIYAIGPQNNIMMKNPEDITLSAFNELQKESSTAFTSYKLPDAVINSYAAGMSPIRKPRTNIFFDEFGSIMREVAYFNVRYDKAYPAFYAKLAPTFNQLQGYRVAGFTANSYGAEFLVFNITDTLVTLDDETGNYLKILGVTFTQQSDNQLSVDKYFNDLSDYSETDLVGSDIVLANKSYQNIKNSILTYGKNEFTIDTPYIQSRDAANKLMGWITSKIMKPRRSVGLKIFPNPAIQLGDIVTINYVANDVEQTVESTARFVVYNISYSRSSSDISMNLYLSEVT